MKFLILGDVHGDWTAMNVTIAKAISKHPDITNIVQVGDLGYGWPGSKPFKASKAFLNTEQMDIYRQTHKVWLDGNHENFDLLENDSGAWLPDWMYMPRGSVMYHNEYRMMFFGGASSIDKDCRTPHRSWWPQESITHGQIAQTLEAIDGPLDAIFSHEHPSSIPYSDERYPGDPFGTSDKEALETLMQKYQPRFWFFGHHHAGDFGVVKGTEWFCCPIIETFKYTIWDGYNAYFDS